MEARRKEEILAKIYLEIRDKSNIEYLSKDEISNLLVNEDLELDDKVVQRYFNNLHKSGFIEFNKDNAMYIKILLRGFDLSMYGVKRWLIRLKDDTVNEFSKNRVTNILNTLIAS